jgi:signal transduction histidine kinase
MPMYLLGRASWLLHEPEPIGLYMGEHTIDGTAGVISGDEAPPYLQVLEFVLAAPAELVLGHDHQGRIIFVNQSLANIVGSKAKDLIGRNLDEILDFRSGTSSLNPQGGPLQATLRRKDGTLVNVKGAALQDGNLFFVTLRPGAKKHAYHDQVTQAQKLEAIGQLAAGIAHEINTPTQYVGDNTRFLKDAFESIREVHADFLSLLVASKEGQPSEEMVLNIEQNLQNLDLDYLINEIPIAIEQTLEGVEQIARIVRAMKEFSHPGGDEKTYSDINTAIENTITVSRNEWKYVADIEKDLDPSLPLVPCLPGAFNQVILNIMVNAAHAIGDVVQDGEKGKGKIKVSTRAKGQFAEIRISDTGSGIPEHARARVFDPFFTTKEVGRGTGQGLALSYSIVVEKHNGTINFETETGEGTTFIIRLPLQADSVAEVAA